MEAVVVVMKRDLSLAYHYLQIAQTYKNARKHDLALEWAERGVEAFPEHTDSRLREFLAEEYHRRKRHDEAMALIWAEFAESPILEEYKKLKVHAQRIEQWESWREKALDYLRSEVEQKTNVKEIDGPGITKRIIRNLYGYSFGKKTWKQHGVRHKRAAAQMTCGWSLPLSEIRIIPKMRCRSTSARSNLRWSGRTTMHTLRPSVSCEKCES